MMASELRQPSTLKPIDTDLLNTPHPDFLPVQTQIGIDTQSIQETPELSSSKCLSPEMQIATP